MSVECCGGGQCLSCGVNTKHSYDHISDPWKEQVEQWQSHIELWSGHKHDDDQISTREMKRWNTDDHISPLGVNKWWIGSMTITSWHAMKRKTVDRRSHIDTWSGIVTILATICRPREWTCKTQLDPDQESRFEYANDEQLSLAVPLGIASAVNRPANDLCGPRFRIELHMISASPFCWPVGMFLFHVTTFC
jgi:hypothetical protein